MDEIQAMIHLKNFEQHSVGSDLGNESENSKKQEEDTKNIRKSLRHEWSLSLARPPWSWLR